MEVIMVVSIPLPKIDSGDEGDSTSMEPVV